MTEKAQLEAIWKQIKEKAAVLVDSYISYSTFIEPLVPVDIEGKKIILKSGTDLSARAVTNKLADRLKEAIESIGMGLNDFKIIVDGSDEFNETDDEESEDDDDPFEPVHIDSKYTFDSFVVGSGNKFVYAAARAVAEAPGESFNPLFIYGGTGLGKTHLMQAIANEIQIKKPSLKVLYTTCEKFLNEFIDNMVISKNNRRMDAKFRARYRNVDILIIDDIQFLAKKVAVQEAFFHTFNELYAQNKQIVISSDRPPKEIATLEDRLRTRFEGGLIVDVQPPDLETKIAILKRKALDKKCVIADDILEYLARDSGNDVRTLEGRLTKVLFASKLHEVPISIELVKTALNESVSESDEKEAITAEAIIKATCEYFSVSEAEVLGKNKKAEIAKARQICTYLLCEMMSLPLISIGQIMGGRDHATVIYSRNKVANTIKSNTSVAKAVDDIKSAILKQ